MFITKQALQRFCTLPKCFWVTCLLWSACAQQPQTQPLASAQAAKNASDTSASTGDAKVDTKVTAEGSAAHSPGAQVTAKGARGADAEKIYQDLLKQKSELEEKQKSLPLAIQETKRVNDPLCKRLQAFRAVCPFFGRLYGEEKSMRCEGLAASQLTVVFQTPHSKKYYLEADFVGRSESFMPGAGPVTLRWIPQVNRSEALGPRFADLSNLRIKPEGGGEVPPSDNVTQFLLSFGGAQVADKNLLLNYEEKAGVTKYYRVSLTSADEAQSGDRCRVPLAEIEDLIIKSKKGF